MEGISLYKCYSGCAFFSFCKCCTALWRPTGQKLESPRPRAHFYWALEGGWGGGGRGRWGGGAGESSSLSVAPSAQVKCTYKIYLHLVVMVAGPAALLGRKLRLRPVVNSKNDNNSGGSSSPAEDFLLPFSAEGYNPARH